jgi:hypothetical protein
MDQGSKREPYLPHGTYQTPEVLERLERYPELKELDGELRTMWGNTIIPDGQNINQVDAWNRFQQAVDTRVNLPDDHPDKIDSQKLDKWYRVMVDAPAREGTTSPDTAAPGPKPSSDDDR